MKKCELICKHRELLTELTGFTLVPIYPDTSLYRGARVGRILLPSSERWRGRTPPLQRWRGEVEGESWGASPSHYPPIQSWQALVQCRAGREFPQAVISSLGLPATAHCSPTLQPTIPSLHSQTLPFWSHHCPLKDQIHPVHNRHVYNVLKKFYPAGI